MAEWLLSSPCSPHPTPPHRRTVNLCFGKGCACARPTGNQSFGVGPDYIATVAGSCGLYPEAEHKKSICYCFFPGPMVLKNVSPTVVRAYMQWGFLLKQDTMELFKDLAKFGTYDATAIGRKSPYKVALGADVIVEVTLNPQQKALPVLKKFKVWVRNKGQFQGRQQGACLWAEKCPCLFFGGCRGSGCDLVNPPPPKKNLVPPPNLLPLKFGTPGPIEQSAKISTPLSLPSNGTRTNRQITLFRAASVT